MGFFNRTTPHLQFTEKEESLGRERLRNIGVPEGALFVCIYSRDSTYLSSAIPSGNWRYHDHRDADIQSYMQAAQQLSARGYYVLRMSAAISEPFTTNDPRIIDYAATHRDEFMDVYLSANCRLFLGPAAGIYAVARIFRRPIACVNYIPLSNAATWSGQGLFIPKTLRCAAVIS